MNDFTHHETIVARTAPEEGPNGHFDVVESGGEFNIYEGDRIVASETTLKKATKAARSEAASYDRAVYARRRAKRDAKRAKPVYVATVHVATFDPTPQQATATIARALNAEDGVAGWHFMLRRLPKGGTGVALPEPAKLTTEQLRGDITASAPKPRIDAKLEDAIRKLIEEVDAHLDYEGDEDMQAAVDAVRELVDEPDAPKAGEDRTGASA